MKARLLLLAVVDLAGSAAVGLLVLSLFAVAGQDDSRPPTCSNRLGATIDCSQDGGARLAAWAVFGVLLLGLWVFHGRRALGSRHD